MGDGDHGKTRRSDPSDRWVRQALTLLLPLGLAAVLGVIMTACSDDGDPVVLPAAGESAAAAPSGPDSDDPYEIVMSVLSSPRCTNCHPTDDQPRQTDRQAVHAFGVTRDAAVQTCSSCHHEENNEYSNVPGAPHWGLAPISMGWLGLSDAELAQTLLDPDANGDRTLDDLFHHMEEDALVLWAWEPGGDREPPPVSHEDFVEALRAWFDAGAPIPSEGG